MKALIWILTFIIGTIINIMIGNAIGIRAGAALLYIVEFYVAKKLCDKWEWRQIKKATFKSVSQSQNESTTKTASEPATTSDNTHKSDLEKSVADGAGQKDLDKAASNNARFCWRCGYELVEGSVFCSKCGAKIDK